MPLEHDVSPEIVAPGDPYAGDEAIFRPGELVTYRMWGGAASEAEVRALEVRFFGRMLEVLQGRARWDDEELRATAGALYIDHPLALDRRPPRVAERSVPDEALADVVEDLLPDCAVLCERVTGHDDGAGVLAAAVLAFVPFEDTGRRPIDWWADEESDRSLIVAARILDSSPPGLFVDGVSLLPLAPKRVPDADTAPRGAVVARPYRVHDGWAWSMVQPLPRAPDADVVLRRLTLALWDERRLDRRTTFEDLLRRRPELLYRACLEAVRG
jgi:hypothetical protein